MEKSFEELKIKHKKQVDVLTTKVENLKEELKKKTSYIETLKGKKATVELSDRASTYLRRISAILQEGQLVVNEGSYLRKLSKRLLAGETEKGFLDSVEEHLVSIMKRLKVRREQKNADGKAFDPSEYSSQDIPRTTI